MTQSFMCRKRCRSDCDEESSEFTPLSKRINNLHINNTLLTATATVETHCHSNHHTYSRFNRSQRVIIDAEDETSVETVECLYKTASALKETMNGLCSHCVNINSGIDTAHDQNQWSTIDVNGRVVVNPAATSVQEYVSRHLLHQEQPVVLQHYNPDLSPSENPYYYENNRLLFTLYMERLQRTNNCDFVVN